MKQRRLIGVIICEADDLYQQRILKGVISQAYAVDCDVAVFAPLTPYAAQTPHQICEENIFNLMQLDKFDGILYARSLFPGNEIRAKLDATLKSKPELPVVVMDEINPDFPYLMNDDRTAFESLVNHFLEVHHFTDIYCLTGYQCSYSAEERAAGYRLALERHGIPAEKAQVFYGDYWISAAEQFGERLVNGDLPMPQAVVCGNDVMAATLCNYLTEHGIEVPETVSIAGYDDASQSRENPVTITTYIRENFKLGAASVAKLYEMMTQEACALAETPEAGLLTRNSCSCGEDRRHIRAALPEIQAARQAETLYKNSNMAVYITLADTIDACMQRIHCSTYLIPDMQDLYLCLCEDWAGNFDPTNPDQYRKTGFSDTMEIKLAHSAATQHHPQSFPTAQMLPALFEKRDKPCAFYFTPLHHNDRFFGYAALSYGDTPNCYGSLYCRWITNINTAIEFIRVRNYLQSFNNRLCLSMIRDPLTGIYNLSGYKKYAQQKFDLAVAEQHKLLVLVANVDCLRQINDNYGHLEGDNAILIASSAITSTFPNHEICARTAGDEFSVTGCFEYDPDMSVNCVASIEQKLTQYNRTSFKPYRVDVSIGVFCGYIPPGATMESLLTLAKQEMQERKKERKAEHVSPYYSEFVALRERIYRNPQEDWNIDAMCREMILSRGYFQKLYTRCFAISFTQDVINSRLKHSKKLLSTTDRSIATIAEQSGYDNYVHFMHQFKKMVGITPTEYRNKKRMSSN